MEKQKENLVLVSRPIDFLNALELCYSNRNKNFVILLFPNRNEQEKNAVDFLESHFTPLLPNATFEKFPISTTEDFLDLFLFKLYLKTVFQKKKFDEMYFSGGLKGRLLYKHVKANRAVMTDEGTFSRKKFPAIIKSGELFTVPRGRKYGFICKILGIKKIKASEDFLLLTMFEELKHKSPKIKLHNFSGLRNYLKNNDSFFQNRDMTIVLGTNPLAHGIDEVTYRKRLVQLFNNNSGSQTLLKTHKTFNKSYGFPLLETKLPIEYYFLKERKIPRAVLSFSSTSNILLGYLFPEIQIENLNFDSA